MTTDSECGMGNEARKLRAIKMFQTIAPDRFLTSDIVDAMLKFYDAERLLIIAELRRKASAGKVGADQQKGTVGFAVTASFAAAYNAFADELEGDNWK